MLQVLVTLGCCLELWLWFSFHTDAVFLAFWHFFFSVIFSNEEPGRGCTNYAKLCKSDNHVLPNAATNDTSRKSPRWESSSCNIRVCRALGGWWLCRDCEAYGRYTGVIWVDIRMWHHTNVIDRHTGVCTLQTYIRYTYLANGHSRHTNQSLISVVLTYIYSNRTLSSYFTR